MEPGSPASSASFWSESEPDAPVLPRSRQPPPPPAVPKGQGKGKGNPPPPPRNGRLWAEAESATPGKGNIRKTSPESPQGGYGKGAPPTPKQEDGPRSADREHDAKDAAPSGPPIHVTATFMDGREMPLELSSTDACLAAKKLISAELGVGVTRLRLIAGSSPLSDHTSLESSGVSDGDVISVIILSPLQGSLTRSGLDVPVDVQEMKMALHAVLEERGQLVTA